MSCLAAIFAYFFKEERQNNECEERISEASTVDIYIQPIKMTNNPLYREPLHRELLDDNFSYSYTLEDLKRRFLKI
jgi:hypothetical protein